MDFGKRIAALRREKGVTQQQLADYLSVLPQTVSRWETGGSPDVALLPKIALFFEITLDELFGMSGLEKVTELVIRYSVLRDEKSYEAADRALSRELARAAEDGNDADRQRLLAERMHLLLQKGWQYLKESEAVADRLIAETEDADNPWHLPVRLQKMQFAVKGAAPSRYLRTAAANFAASPSMETLQLYFLALLESGQADRVLAESESGYVQEVLARQSADSLTVWDILFQAAADTENLDFFQRHFKAYEALKTTLTGSDNCLEVRLCLAKLYASLGRAKEKEACRERLLLEAQSVENELMRKRMIETIEQI